MKIHMNKSKVLNKQNDAELHLELKGKEVYNKGTTCTVHLTIYM
ncbi:hypothetical protein Hdeb2414_s0025g00665821 [Helianthus debilis subsp. tardiflorus]